MELAKIIDQCPFFARVSAEGRARLLGMAAHRRYAKGELILRQDAPCPGLFVVGTGAVRIYKIGPSGKEHVLHLARPGHTFAEAAVIGGFSVPAFAEALDDTECALLPVEPFTRALREDHALCLQIIISLSHWTKQLVTLMEDIVLRDATSRVASYLLQAQAGPAGTVQLPGLKKHLASHLNLTSETLSRSLRRLEDAGLISQENGQLLVTDLEGLRNAAVGASPDL